MHTISFGTLRHHATGGVVDVYLHCKATAARLGFTLRHNIVWTRPTFWNLNCSQYLRKCNFHLSAAFIILSCVLVPRYEYIHPVRFLLHQLCLSDSNLKADQNIETKIVPVALYG